MTHRILMVKPIYVLLLMVTVILMPIIAQDEDTAAVQDEVKPVVEDESEVAVVPDTDSIPDLTLKPGDIAPSWALMYAPAKFEFLKNWTVERGAKLRKFKSQPNRHVVVVSDLRVGVGDLQAEPCTVEVLGGAAVGLP